MSADNATIIGRFLAEEVALTAALRDGATRCLIDWMGVAIAGAHEPVAQAVMRYAGFDGAPLIAASDAEKAALVNGTAAHALDFDDTHIPTDSHFSAVIWAALLAIAKPGAADGPRLLRAFVAGYEVAAKLAGRRVGFSLQFRWFHPSGVLGHFAAAAAVAAYEKLDATQAAHAIALAATQAAGLRGTLGSMAKPVQVGRAAMNGIVSARMAQAGVEADRDVLQPAGGFARAFVQDGTADLAALQEGDLGRDWAVLRTSFKPYACLHGIHPSIDAAREIHVEPQDIVAVRAYVAPGVKQVARFNTPTTPLQAKFSVEFCVAMALLGRQMGAADFSDDHLADPTVHRLMEMTTVLPEDGRKMLDSAVEIDLSDGRTMRGETALSHGHPGNPLGWDDLEAKFLTLSEPAIGGRAQALLAALRAVDQSDAILEIKALIDGSR